MDDRLIAAGLAAAVLLSRLPFVARELFQWDSVLYAQALEHGFHVSTEIADERPHPPGYLFYVALARAARALTGDSNLALVAIAVLASAAAVAAAYLLARRFAPGAPAAIAALGLAASPLFWQQSEVALPYTVLALLSTVLAGLFLRAREGRAHPVAVALAFGLLSGLRQDLPLLLGPLWLWSLAPAPGPERWRALAAAAAGSLAWLVPSAVLSGGLDAYLGAVGGEAGHVSETFSVAARGEAGLVRNVALVGYALAWGAAAFAIPLVLAGGARLVATRGHAAGAAFFALWLLPALVVYAGLHIGYPGYVLSVLPGLYVLCAALLARALGAGRTVVAAGAALVAANALAFVALPGPFAASSIAAHDRSIADRVAYVRARVPPAGATLLAQFDYVFVRYYLPEYRVLFYGEAPEVLSRAPVPVTVTARDGTVVLFGATAGLPAGLRREPAPGDLADSLATVRADGDARLTAYDVEPGRRPPASTRERR